MTITAFKVLAFRFKCCQFVHSLHREAENSHQSGNLLCSKHGIRRYVAGYYIIIQRKNVSSQAKSFVGRAPNGFWQRFYESSNLDTTHTCTESSFAGLIFRATHLHSYDKRDSTGLWRACLESTSLFLSETCRKFPGLCSCTAETETVANWNGCKADLTRYGRAQQKRIADQFSEHDVVVVSNLFWKRRQRERFLPLETTATTNLNSQKLGKKGKGEGKSKGGEQFDRNKVALSLSSATNKFH